MVDQARRDSFDEIAELYDQIRPGYPAQLFEDIIIFAGLKEDSRLLEIGCGPAKASLPFARRGYRLLCLDIGERMAALATQKLSPYPRAEVCHTSFEAWSLEADSFDLVFAAQAFHWISEAVAFSKTAAALKPDGTLALFWHYAVASGSDLERELDGLYQAALPDSHASLRPVSERISYGVGVIEQSGYFGEVTVKRYPWSSRASTEEYLRRMQTESNIRTLAGKRRSRLLADVQAILDRAGGFIERSHEAVLYLSRVL